MYYNDLLDLCLIKEGIYSRSITPENPSGEPGKGGMAEIGEEEMKTHPARELGRTWKIRPSISIPD